MGGAAKKLQGIQPGVYPEIPNEAYHSGEGVSKSMLDKLAVSPAHLRFGERKETPSMEIGTAAHTAILEPEWFEKRYFQGEDIRRGTKAWQELEEAAGERAVLKPKDWELCMRMRDSVHGHAVAAELLDGRHEWVEQSAYWIDPDTGLLCRCRPDYARPDLRALVDLKTTVDASPQAFAKSCANYRYHVQDAMYREGYSRASGEAIEAFVFIAVEKEPPFAVGVYELEPHAVERGHASMRDGLDLYARCKNNDEWPGYSGAIEMIDLPAWAY